MAHGRTRNQLKAKSVSAACLSTPRSGHFEEGSPVVQRGQSKDNPQVSTPGRAISTATTVHNFPLPDVYLKPNQMPEDRYRLSYISSQISVGSDRLQLIAARALRVYLALSQQQLSRHPVAKPQISDPFSIYFREKYGAIVSNLISSLDFNAHFHPRVYCSHGNVSSNCCAFN